MVGFSMTARALQRRGTFTLACMAVVLAIVLVMWLISTVRAEPYHGAVSKHRADRVRLS
jgi:hypothetical protein